jgi:hypothetical protein
MAMINREREETRMSFTQHAFSERYKIALSSLVTAVGFLIALLANRYREKAEFFVFEDKDPRWLETLKPIWWENVETCEKEINLVIEQL